MFWFFGSHLDDTKNQMINAINQSSTIVEIEFSIGTVQYKVIRGIKLISLRYIKM